MTARVPRELVLRGPLEHDIQAWILTSLGVEQFEVKRDRDGKWRKHSLGMYIGRNGAMFWRQNCGSVRAPSGARLRLSVPGCPDIVGIVCGRFVGIEVKREGEKQNENQKRFEAWLLACGGVYRVVRSPTEAQDVVDEILDALS